MIKQEDIQLNVRHAIETQIYTVVCSFYVTRRHRRLAVSHSSGVLGSVTCYFHVPDVFFSLFSSFYSSTCACRLTGTRLLVLLHTVIAASSVGGEELDDCFVANWMKCASGPAIFFSFVLFLL